MTVAPFSHGFIMSASEQELWNVVNVQGSRKGLGRRFPSWHGADEWSLDSGGRSRSALDRFGGPSSEGVANET